MSVVVLSDERPLARVTHHCEVCGGTIASGEHYRRQRNIFDGDPYTWKAHLLCDAAMTWLRREQGYFPDESPDPQEALDLVRSVFAAFSLVASPEEQP